MLKFLLHGERAAAATGALGTEIADAETSVVQVVVEIDRDVAEVHQAALVHHHLDTVECEQLVELGVDRRIEIQLVLEAAATSADHPHAQVELPRRGSRLLLVADDTSYFRSSLLRQSNGLDTFPF
jgi:hypothetical protein